MIKQIDNFDRLQEKVLKVIKNIARFDGIDVDIIGNRQMFFRYAEIRYINKHANETLIHLANGQELASSLTIEEWDKLLPNLNFIKTHRSNIINSDYFINFVANKGLIKLRGSQPEEIVKSTKREHKRIMAQIFEYEMQQARGTI